ncbi:MAG TPA: SAM-dependent methyltransferase [Blastocatellia bacterium]|nr:SAM-dependent methyltransferase [Blastocatellia bacterium]
MTSASTPLEQKLIERIGCEGPMTFRDFMQAALYDPELGYYNTERAKIGPEGDYFTSSNVHPAFGAGMSRAFAELWETSSEAMTIIEFGAGTGQLACDVLTAMRDEHPRLFDGLTYLIVETSPAMRDRQREKLSAFADRVRWTELEELERAPVRGVVFSNEFVDALPVHSVRFRAGSLEESYVTSTDRSEGPGTFSQSWGKPSTDRLAEYVDRMKVELREDQIVEINLDAVDWLSWMTRALDSGYLMTIDYGDLCEALWTPDRLRGTLRSFHNHRLIDSPLTCLGEQDITASVNFTALIEYGREFGFEPVSFARQPAFLIRMGLIERIAASYRPDETLDDLKQRLTVKNLFVPGGISDSFRVLIQRKHH